MLKPLSAIAVLLLATPAFAQADVPGYGGDSVDDVDVNGGAAAVDITLEIAAISDYRFRGISRSDEDPAGQAALLVFHESGLYGGIRGTTLRGRDNFRAIDSGFGDQGDVQADLFAGWRGSIGSGFDLDAGVTYYAFAGGDGPTDYVEPYASLGYLIGPVTLSGGAKYAPAQDGTGDEDMLYLFGQVDVVVPFRPWTFTAQAGRQDWGVYGAYWTWSLGAEYHVQIEGIPTTYVGLRYIDTDFAAPGADAGLAASLTIRF